MGQRGPKSERVLFLSENFLRHPKIRSLTDAEFRCWIEILIEQLRTSNGAELPAWNVLSKRRRERLLELGLLDEIDGRLHIHGWESWNGREAYKRFLTRERVRRLRERRASET